MRRSRKWNATLETAQRGEVKHLLRCTRCLTSLEAARCPACAARPARRILEVARLYLIRRDNPSSEADLSKLGINANKIQTR
jgi:hypothetical protein